MLALLPAVLALVAGRPALVTAGGVQPASSRDEPVAATIVHRGDRVYFAGLGGGLLEIDRVACRGAPVQRVRLAPSVAWTVEAGSNYQRLRVLRPQGDPAVFGLDVDAGAPRGTVALTPLDLVCR